MYRPRQSDLWPTRYGVGMWAWLLQRLSGIVIVIYLFFHIWVISTSLQGGQAFDRVLGNLQNPFILALELLLFWAILYHTFNGFRVILFDLGYGVRQQKAVFWAVMAVAVLFLAAGIVVAWPFLTGKPLA